MDVIKAGCQAVEQRARELLIQVRTVEALCRYRFEDDWQSDFIPEPLRREMVEAANQAIEPIKARELQTAIDAVNATMRSFATTGGLLG